MKLLPFAMLVSACSLCAETQPLKQVQSVYVLPMAGAMDQYLANKITKQALFQVVTDPKLADAILTDRIGESFEHKLADLYAPPKKADDKDKDSKSGENDMVGPPLDQPSSFGRGRGTYFLVDRKSRAVLWSTYDRPNNMRADTLDKTADHIIKRLKQDLTPKETPK